MVMAMKRYRKQAWDVVQPGREKQVPSLETIAAMLEARSMHEPRFESAEELFASLDHSEQQNSISKSVS